MTGSSLPPHDMPLDTVLVTGPTGLLGHALVTALLERGTEVRALVRDEHRARQVLPDRPGLRLVPGDVTDVSGFASRLRGCDAVFHLAAYFREYYQPHADVDLLMRTNVRAVHELLHAAAETGVPTVVHTSSTGALAPDPARGPADEDTPNGSADQRHAYRASKVRAEQVVADFTARYAEHGVRVPMVLPGWMWGPGDSGPTSAGRLFLAVATGQVRALPRVGNHLVDARDVADALVAAALRGRPGRRYIAAGRWHTLAEISAGIVRAAGSGTVPRQIPAGTALGLAALAETAARFSGRTPVATRTGIRTLMEGHHARFSSTRATRELGVTFRPLHQTLADQAAWHRVRGQLPLDAAPAGRR
ncbi:NAD-dependent epimerase/dehydratase family protein [Streptomyces sp. VRA16 Mangrove soil]|uniref:NAD-dependent epimerase/dehydratase family protein n=1 Tax=Streptomyces sp. VRA16 Mangrove soil TaxID=2817434 RepID=UPI001A9E51B4|nr:NAD-dependent epimerase/dehydratase family protein [Streptomyces sp. VRA16 Mangrove soil]MBO1334260.1 NAD-dependent epimerase/dehydratase family protein [Streptomyces sp. VRA16 Mangrove soil]